MTEGPLQGRHAVVTGAGRGIGAAIAARLVAGGARVTLLSRTQRQLEDVGATLGVSAQCVCADITDWHAVRQALEGGGAEGDGFKIAMRTLDVFRSSVAAAATGFARRDRGATVSRDSQPADL